MKRIRRARGFTLVELIIVIGLLGFLITALFGSYFQIKQLLLIENEAAITGNRAMLALKTISEDLNNLFIEGRWNPKQIFEIRKDTIGSKRVDFMNFASTKLFSNPQTMQSSVRMVTYYGEVDEESGRVNLMRREDIFLDKNNPTAGVAIPLFQGIEKLEVQFSRDGGSFNDEDWSYASKRTYPRYIQVTMGWKEQGRDREYSFEVRPPIVWN